MSSKIGEFLERFRDSWLNNIDRTVTRHDIYYLMEAIQADLEELRDDAGLSPKWQPQEEPIPMHEVRKQVDDKFGELLWKDKPASLPVLKDLIAAHLAQYFILSAEDEHLPLIEAIIQASSHYFRERVEAELLRTPLKVGDILYVLDRAFKVEPTDE